MTRFCGDMISRFLLVKMFLSLVIMIENLRSNYHWKILSILHRQIQMDNKSENDRPIFDRMIQRSLAT